MAKMKPIVPSQSKSPASVPRLPEMSGSVLLYMFGLYQCRPRLTMVLGVRFLLADRGAVVDALLLIR